MEYSFREEHFHYDWAKDMKEFHDTKLGVKGLVDAGVVKVPRLFVRSADEVSSEKISTSQAQVVELPTIDFQGLEMGGKLRQKIVDEIREASEIWGFFRIVNHGLPMDIMDAMIEGVRRFHEQPNEVKMDFYSTDSRRRVRFLGHVPDSEFDAGCWKDMLTFVCLDDKLDPEAIPMVCRKEVEEYLRWMIKLRETMAELLSEALGLSTDYLSDIECMKSQSLACLYYPACPEPEKTLGTARHSDTTFLTLLLQDSLGGLQIRHENQWVDVPPLRGSLIVNIGDLMQIISNDKFKSVEHRVLAQSCGPRISIACFLIPSETATSKPFSPIKEILSDKNPAIYREFLFHEYIKCYRSKGDHGHAALSHFKIA